MLPVVTIATLSALDAVPDELLHASRSLGASPLYTMLHVRLRAAVPGVITGMRIAMGGAWTSIVAAEMIAATGGVGFLILQAGNYLQTPLIFSGIAVIAVLGFVFDNRITQHYAIDNYDDLPRKLARVTIAGDVPAGVDGRRSVSLEGDAAHYTPAEPSRTAA